MDIIDYKIDNNNIPVTSVVKDLGLYITDDLKWTTYINKILLKSNHMSYIILNSFQSRIPSLYVSLYKTYVRPIVEYNVSIWSPQLVTEIRLVESVQKSFTRKVCKKLNIKYENYKHRLDILGLETLEYRRTKLDLILLYKILNNFIDINSNLFFSNNHVQSIYNLRRHTQYLINPKPSRTSVRNNFYSNRIVKIWNKLPDSIVTSRTIHMFKFRLNQFSLTSLHDFVFK